MTATIEATEVTPATSDEQLKNEVIHVLESVLADARFAAAPQMSAFLNYVVRQTLAGEADRIKAYTVGVDALGKPETFDPQNDPSVRVLAKRLRTFLDEYNVRTAAAPLYIELRPGSYRPLFLTRPEHGTCAPDAESPDTIRVKAPLPVHTAPAKPASSVSNSTPADDGYPTILQPSPTQESASVAIPPVDKATQPSTAAAPIGIKKTGNSLGRGSLILAVAAAGLLYSLAQIGNLGPASDDTLTASIDGTANSAFDAGAPAAALPVPRPSRPQIEVLGFRADQSSLDTQIATLLSSTMLNAGELDVLRGSGDTQIANGWPERYLLSLQAVSVGEQAVRLEMQLVNASDQRLAHASSLKLSTTEAGYLDATSMETLEALALSLTNESGPLITDYTQHYVTSEQKPADESSTADAR